MELLDIQRKWDMDSETFGAIYADILQGKKSLRVIADEYNFDYSDFKEFLDDLELFATHREETFNEGTEYFDDIENASDDTYTMLLNDKDEDYENFDELEDEPLEDELEDEPLEDEPLEDEPIQNISDFAPGEKVIVTKPIGDLRYGQVITVLNTARDHITFKQGRKEIAIPKSNVEKLISERNIRKDIALHEKQFVKRYIKYLKNGYNHNEICESLAREQQTTVEDVENILAHHLDEEGERFIYNMATDRVINAPIAPYSDPQGYFERPRKSKDYPYRGEEYFYSSTGYTNNPDVRIHSLNSLASDEDIENAYNIVLKEQEDIEQIADDVFMELIKNSNKYRESYKTLEDAVYAIISVKNLIEKVGKTGAKKSLK